MNYVTTLAMRYWLIGAAAMLIVMTSITGLLPEGVPVLVGLTIGLFCLAFVVVIQENGVRIDLDPSVNWTMMTFVAMFTPMFLLSIGFTPPFLPWLYILGLVGLKGVVIAVLREASEDFIRYSKADNTATGEHVIHMVKSETIHISDLALSQYMYFSHQILAIIPMLTLAIELVAMYKFL